jgi:hypothetical protein
MKTNSEQWIDLLEKLNRGRGANAEGKYCEQLFYRNGISSEPGYGSESRLNNVGSGFGSRRVRGHAHRTFSRVGTVGVMMGNESNC